MGSLRDQNVPARIVATCLVAVAAFLGPGVDAVAAFVAPHSGDHHAGQCQADLCRCRSGCPTHDGGRTDGGGGASADADRSAGATDVHRGGTSVYDHPDGCSLLPSPSIVPATASWGVLTADQPPLDLLSGADKDVPAARPADRQPSPSNPPPRAASG